MAFYQTGSRLGVDLNNAASSSLFTLMDRVMGGSDSLWVYAQAAGAITSGDLCVITSAGTAQRATTGNVFTENTELGIPQCTFIDQQYGWFARNGVGLTVNVSGTTVGIAVGGATAQLYVATTSGKLTNTASSATIAGIQVADISSTAVAVATTGSVAWPRCIAVSLQ